MRAALLKMLKRALGEGEATSRPEASVSPTRPPLEEKQKQFDLLFAELDRRRAAQDRRASTAESRAGVLIASSAIVTGLFAEGATGIFRGESAAAMLIPLAFSIAAAGLGIAAMFPQPIAEIASRRVRKKILMMDAFSAHEYLSMLHVVVAESMDKVTSRRHDLVRYGLILLGLSLVAAFAVVGIQMQGGET